MDISVKWPKRSEDTASRVVDGEAVIVIPQKGVVTVLNETGSGIWQLLDGRNSIEDITNKRYIRFYRGADRKRDGGTIVLLIENSRSCAGKWLYSNRLWFCLREFTTLKGMNDGPTV
jgi:hypothetical protein